MQSVVKLFRRKTDSSFCHNEGVIFIRRGCREYQTTHLQRKHPYPACPAAAFLASVAACLGAPRLASAAANSAAPEIAVDNGGWGQASPVDIRAVLLSTAGEVWPYCAGERIKAIRVYHRDDFPQTDFVHDWRGRIRVGLHSSDAHWAQIAFQFGHEFCHALAQHSAIALRGWHPPRHANLWFEESLCETSSLFVLRRLGVTWQQNPPYEIWRSYAPAMAKYASDRLALPEHQLPADITFPVWFRQNEAAIRENAVLREKNVIIARQLLPLFEAEPAAWRGGVLPEPGRASAGQTARATPVRMANQQPGGVAAICREDRRAFRMNARAPIGRIPRRTFLKAAVAFTASLGLHRAHADTTAADAAQKVHDEIWRRFVDEHHLVLDYTDFDGSFPRATAEECREGKPNALGWWTPIENGSMFNGLYLDAAVHRWKISRADADKEKARRLANALLSLASLGPPGFIARGVATDSKTPYPMGSNDQTSPWFYGLWRFIHEGLATPAERTLILARMATVADALLATGWLLPCNAGAPAPFRGSLKGFTWEAAPRLLFELKAMHNLTRDPKWADLYQTVAQERSGSPPLSRLEICARGMQFRGTSRQSWTGSAGVVCLRGLWEMETNPDYIHAYMEGLAASVTLAAAGLPLAAKFDNEATAPCLLNWRQLNPWWKPQHSEAEAVGVAERQAKELGRLSPRRDPEFNLVRESLFSAWIVTLCPDRTLVEPHRATILGAIQHFDYKRLYYSQFFPGEAAAYRLQLLRKA